jgi:hypothetical protein
LLGSNVLSPSLEPDVVSTVALSNSLEWQSRSEVEWSIDIEAPFVAHSLLLFSFILVKINNIPSLSLGSIVTPNSNWVAFNILAAFNVKSLAALPVDELVVLVFKDLEPS